MPNDAPETSVIGFDQPQGAGQVGAGMRAVRERLGWKLADVADELRIRLPYLEAIESGNLSALPGPAYQTGFIRSYAQILGLDPEEILRRFRAEGMGGAPKAELSFLAPVPDRAVPTGAIVLVGVVLVLVGYGLWFRHTEQERRLAAAVPSVPAQLAPLAVPPKPVTPPAPKPAAMAAAAPAGAPAVTAMPTVTTPTTEAPAAVGSAGTAPGVAATMPAPAAVVPVPPMPPVTATAATGQTILATADSWVEVRDATGGILFSRVLHAGESWPVPQEAGLTMTAGNAGGTEISDNGKPGTPLGAPGAVLHNYALTPTASAGATAAPGTVAPPAATASPGATTK